MSACVRQFPHCDLPKATCGKDEKGKYYCRCGTGYAGNGNTCTGKYLAPFLPPTAPRPLKVLIALRSLEEKKDKIEMTSSRNRWPHGPNRIDFTDGR